MPAVKKLIFAPIFIIFLALLLFFFSPFLKSLDLIFSLSLATFLELILLGVLVLLTCLSFVLLVTLALDWKLILPVIIASCLIPFLFFPAALALVLAVLIFVGFLITSFTLENKLKSYLTFNPTVLLSPSIKQLSALLILAIAITYYLSINTQITTNGFQIPDSLIDTALKLSNPQAESIPFAGDVIKQTVKDQMQNFLNPYLGFIPAVLAILLFFTLQSLTSIINLLTYPLLWIIFYILEKSGFVTFTTEMRPVKKMMV